MPSIPQPHAFPKVVVKPNDVVLSYDAEDGRGKIEQALDEKIDDRVVKEKIFVVKAPGITRQPDALPHGGEQHGLGLPNSASKTPQFKIASLPNELLGEPHKSMARVASAKVPLLSLPSIPQPHAFPKIEVRPSEVALPHDAVKLIEDGIGKYERKFIDDVVHVPKEKVVVPRIPKATQQSDVLGQQSLVELSSQALQDTSSLKINSLPDTLSLEPHKGVVSVVGVKPPSLTVPTVLQLHTFPKITVNPPKITVNPLKVVVSEDAVKLVEDRSEKLEKKLIDDVVSGSKEKIVVPKIPAATKQPTGLPDEKGQQPLVELSSQAAQKTSQLQITSLPDTLSLEPVRTLVLQDPSKKAFESPLQTVPKLQALSLQSQKKLVPVRSDLSVKSLEKIEPRVMIHHVNPAREVVTSKVSTDRFMLDVQSPADLRKTLVGVSGPSDKPAVMSQADTLTQEPIKAVLPVRGKGATLPIELPSHEALTLREVPVKEVSKEIVSPAIAVVAVPSHKVEQLDTVVQGARSSLSKIVGGDTKISRAGLHSDVQPILPLSPQHFVHELKEPILVQASLNESSKIGSKTMTLQSGVQSDTPSRARRVLKSSASELLPQPLSAPQLHSVVQDVEVSKVIAPSEEALKPEEQQPVKFAEKVTQAIETTPLKLDGVQQVGVKTSKRLSDVRLQQEHKKPIESLDLGKPAENPTDALVQVDATQGLGEEIGLQLRLADDFSVDKSVATGPVVRHLRFKNPFKKGVVKIRGKVPVVLTAESQGLPSSLGSDENSMLKQQDGVTDAVSSGQKGLKSFNIRQLAIEKYHQAKEQMAQKQIKEHLIMMQQARMASIAAASRWSGGKWLECTNPVDMGLATAIAMVQSSMGPLKFDPKPVTFDPSAVGQALPLTGTSKNGFAADGLVGRIMRSLGSVPRVIP